MSDSPSSPSVLLASKSELWSTLLWNNCLDLGQGFEFPAFLTRIRKFCWNSPSLCCVFLPSSTHCANAMFSYVSKRMGLGNQSRSTLCFESGFLTFCPSSVQLHCGVSREDGVTEGWGWVLGRPALGRSCQPCGCVSGRGAPCSMPALPAPCCALRSASQVSREPEVGKLHASAVQISLVADVLQRKQVFLNAFLSSRLHL